MNCSTTLTLETNSKSPMRTLHAMQVLRPLLLLGEKEEDQQELGRNDSKKGNDNDNNLSKVMIDLKMSVGEYSLCHSNYGDQAKSELRSLDGGDELVESFKSIHSNYTDIITTVSSIMSLPLLDPSVGEFTSSPTYIDVSYGENPSVAIESIILQNGLSTASGLFVSNLVKYRSKAFAVGNGLVQVTDSAIRSGYEATLIIRKPGSMTTPFLLSYAVLLSFFTLATLRKFKRRKPSPTVPRPSVDFLKGVAMIATIHNHSIECFFPPSTLSIYSTSPVILLPLTLLSNGSRGVGLSFFLTGLVNALSYVKAGDSFNPYDFYKKRLSSLYPKFVLFTGLIMAVKENPDLLSWNFYSKSLRLYTGIFGFLPNWWDTRVDSCTHLWSLGVHFCFLALFPVLAPLLLKSSPQRSLLTTVCIGMACFGVRSFVMLGNMDGYDGVIIKSNLRITYAMYLRDSILGRADDFVVGALAGRLASMGWRVDKGHRSSLAVVAIGWILLGCWIWDYVNLSCLPLTAFSFISPCLQVGNLLLFFLVLSVVETRSFKALSMPIQWMGKCSLYLLFVHGVTVNGMLMDWRKGDSIEAFILRGLLYIAILFSFCFILDNATATTTTKLDGGKAKKS